MIKQHLITFSSTQVSSHTIHLLYCYLPCVQIHNTYFSPGCVQPCRESMITMHEPPHACQTPTDSAVSTHGLSSQHLVSNCHPTWPTSELQGPKDKAYHETLTPLSHFDLQQTNAQTTDMEVKPWNLGSGHRAGDRSGAGPAPCAQPAGKW